MTNNSHTSPVSLSADSGATFLIRWRGRQEGPYTAAVIEAKLAANQIGLLHELCHQGQWVTLRDYFAERDAARRAESREREELARRAREEADREAKEREEKRAATTLTEERFKTASPPQIETSSPDWHAGQSPLCRTCGLGRLMKLDQYRMSLPVVVIGYFLLVPSAIGMLLSVMGLVFYLIGGGVQVSQSAAPNKGVAVLATMVGSGFFLFLIVISFVGGVFGWLLIMKKKVLRCTHCGAVVTAS
jgi:hypothetical protein